MMASPGSLILITGASGFIGNHIVHEFLKAGYKVRVAVRTQQSGEKTVRLHHSSGALDYVVVPDITTSGAFDEAVKDVDGVVHSASPFKLKVENNEQDLLQPAINGTLQILRAVTDHAPKVKRVVITSSFAAVADFSKGLNPGYTYTESDWNPMDYAAARDDTAGLAYTGSKKLAEKAAWDFLAEQKDARFTITTINPPMVYGPAFPGAVDLQHLGQSPGEIYDLMNGSLQEVPPTRLPAFADVRDVGLAHVRAYETSATGRFIVCSGEWSKQQVCDLFRARLPGMEGRVPVGSPGSLGPECYAVDTARAREVLGMDFRKFEETFLDMARVFLALEEAAL